MFKIIFLTLLLVFSLFSCSSAPKFVSKRVNTEKQLNQSSALRFSERITKSDSVLKTEIGIASYYAEKFNGKPTYSGEIYDMNGISAAHPFYPMGTIVRVTNLKNGEKIVLEINDKMPYREDRIIDLSLGAARKLGMLKNGLAKVKAEVLKWGKGKK